MCMQFLLFFCRPQNLRILKPKEDNYSDNCSERAYKQGTTTVKEFTNKVIGHVESREKWRFRKRGKFMQLYGRFGSVKNSECTESSSAWMFVCFLCAIFTLLCMLILQKLCFYKEAVLLCFMLISLFFTSSKKGDNLSNRMGGSVRSTFQEVQRIHELEFSNTSFMLSLHFFSLSIMRWDK